ncbi:flagellin N-terminal helical domain-containing protein [Aquaspirillum soli]
MFINTNVASLNSQRQLAGSTGLLATATQRLSSGLRINSAKDDAAGMSISERMTAQVKGLDQAKRNANDGISLAQTAEGALTEVGNNLQRVRELAVQAANSTNKLGDRQTIQDEITQLKNEIQRMTEQTSFNGNKLLDGSFTAKTFQVGADAGQAITIDSVANTNLSSLGGRNYVRGVSAVATGSISKAAGTGGVDAIANGLKIKYTDSNGAAQSVSLGSIGAASTGEQRAGQIVEAINKQSEKTGVTATLDENNKIQVRSNGSLGELSKASFSLTGGWSASKTGLSTKGGASLAGNNTLGITDLTVTGHDSKNATNAIARIDNAIKEVNAFRAKLGAFQNRFSSAITSLQTSSENISASRSRIKDADFANESASLARANVLQQAGTAMLAQANQQPQQALQLLR